MADGDEPTTTVKEVHVGLTQAQLDDKIQQAETRLKTLLDDNKREHADEIKKAHDRIEELEKEKEERRKADEDKAKAAGGGTTMVTPPAAMPPAQPSTPEPETQGGNAAHAEEAKKPGFFKSLW